MKGCDAREVVCGPAFRGIAQAGNKCDSNLPIRSGLGANLGVCGCYGEGDRVDVAEAHILKCDDAESGPQVTRVGLQQCQSSSVGRA